jgi:predicted NAD/FAD-binding protein
VFELTDRLGGNCHSAYLGATPHKAPFGDLGVNDFNTARYKNFMAVLAQLEKDGFPVPHEPLIDTTSWSTPRGVVSGARTYTDEDMVNWQQHVADRPWLRNIAKDWDAFQKVAHDVLTKEKYAHMTVDEFIIEQGYSYDFAEYNLRARINGMYYVNDTSPGSMPIRAVMSYYHLQEGIGDEKRNETRRSDPRPLHEQESPRHFFTHGASDWIEKLTRCLKERGVKFCMGKAHHSPQEPPILDLQTPMTNVRFAEASDTFAAKWKVISPACESGAEFDHVISAVPADRVGQVIDRGLTNRMVTAFSHFDYYNSIGIVHNDESLLPEDKAAWSTYNILVYPPGCRMLRPYTITYVSHKHQGRNSNDPPFVTLTPYEPIDVQKVETMLDLLAQDREPAVGYFRHNTLTSQAILEQENLHEEQGRNGLWFTGGWTNGAGLHEEILAMSKEIAEHIRRFPDVAQAGYHGDDLGTAPEHILNSFKPDADPFRDGFWDTLEQ